MKQPYLATALLLLLFAVSPNMSNLTAQTTTEFVYGDALPDAPELAKRGEYAVGVRTLDFVNPGQLDVLHVTDGQAATYDRPLTVEVWYPAAVGTDNRRADPLRRSTWHEGQPPNAQYALYLCRPRYPGC